MDALNLFALQLAAALIVGGILLTIVAFLIYVLNEAKKDQRKGAAPQANVFDVLVELAKRLPVLFVPGILMIGLGVAIVLAVVGGQNTAQ